MKVTDVFISGIGVHLPDTVPIEQAVADGLIAEGPARESGYTGAAVAGDMPPVEMALAASRQALARSGQDPTGLSLLLYADNYNNGPVGWYPQAYLQRHLVGGHLATAEVRQGCNGMFAALELAAGFLAGQGPDATAMTVAADNISMPHVNRWQCLAPDFVVGDAASAVVLTRAPGVAQLLSVTSTTVVELEEMGRGRQPLFPSRDDAAAWDLARRIEDFQVDVAARDDGESPWLPLIKARIEVIDQALDEAGIKVSDITRVAYNHSSRQHMEDGVLRTLGIGIDRSNWEFGRHLGHLGSSDQVVFLDHALRSGELAPGNHLLMLGISPGLNIAAAVVRILAAPSWSSSHPQRGTA